MDERLGGTIDSDGIEDAGHYDSIDNIGPDDVDIMDDDEMEVGYDVLTLISDDGEEFQFELLDRGEVDGAEYVALVPLADEDPAEEEADGELVFMKAVVDGDEEFLESIEDDTEYERVSEYFTERLSEYFDIG